MKIDIKKWLFDVLEASRNILAFVANKSEEIFEADLMCRMAVEREFTIIGEAVNQALKIQPDLLDRISHAKQIVGFRHLLVHAYFAVKHQVVWDIVQNDVPVLVKEVEELLAQG